MDWGLTVVPAQAGTQGPSCTLRWPVATCLDSGFPWN